ncbi:hypothetical protein PtrSN002B_006688 [Pyrenophora tritici-repentis]|uniref:Uncharacterized protein n=2 Tax=Pyrenophora tritici-repentis TaxID=45151 RepID=A0A2W1DGI5_9PLEO|nr:uncharacterized protein PTRG_00269 [Pyrenophora tritici-repentis Pt-1C-BFP]KAA8624856.1 hypothetical protein PtrV1_00536 [Pyrenophora tritici-repentis]EDU39707.1 conserved hypothetical protein [Pyrenophora tritici-repentis Pt-1C-BFP]KAF7453252.1 hypothetical protein A1F99_005100 [Pyrenophora tritici-repentis]KAF7576314.1 hypothetical protein PtrM4_005540 [Pyrenophora tritici-repentis]KAG9377294.1 hypothetical protein A1F94_011697 [Pyrenophora tritici-repentis]
MSITIDDTRASNDNRKNNRRNRRSSQKNSCIATLSAIAQVQKVLYHVNNFNGSYHLRNWSASARKERAPYIGIKLELLHDGSYIAFNVPKLAFIAASPAFADHMAISPDVKLLRFCSSEVDFYAVKAIVIWLRKICSEKVHTDLPIPEDIEEDLQLRRTARRLGMSQYVADIIERYILDLADRVPDVSELVLVCECTKDQGIVDPMSEVLANCVGYLLKYNQVDGMKVGLYAEVLKTKKCQRLLDAICEEKLDRIHRVGWLAVYKKPWK